MLSERHRCFAIVSVLVAILGVSVGGAVAQDNRPRTQDVSGTFTASPVNVEQRTCDGQDGAYLEIRGKIAGEITSSEPRLAGSLEVTAEPALINTDTGFGTFQGRFRITDPATGMLKSEGQFHTVVTEGGLNHSFAFGTVMNQGGGPSDNVFVSFKATFDAALNVIGEFGSVSGDSRTPAVVQGGHCSGAFTHIP